jgi:hypothetical protein
MKPLIFLLTLATILLGQAAPVIFTTSCLPSSAKPATQVTCTTVVSGSPVSAQGIITVNAGTGLNPVTWTVTTTDIGKQVVGTPGGTNIFLLYGMNATPIPNGTLIAFTFAMPASNVLVGITQPVASDANGGQLVVTTNPPVAVTLPLVVNNCDINGDGLVNGIDVGLLVERILRGVTFVTALQQVINAALGGACTL